MPFPHFTSAPAIRGVPSGSFERSSSTTGSATGLSLPSTPTYISRPSTYSSISTGESKLACSQSIRSISSRIDDDDGVELDADRAVLARRLDDDRELEVVREVEAAAKRAREDRRVDAVELEDLLGDRLVLRVEQAVRAGAGEALVDQLEVGGDAVVGGVVAGERLGEVEDEIAVACAPARAGP